MLKQSSAEAHVILNPLLVFAFLQVHGLDNSTWENTEIVNIDIADRSCISTKVRASQVVCRNKPRFWSLCCKYSKFSKCSVKSTCCLLVCFIFVMAMLYHCRTTTQNMTQPSLSPRRRVEDLWDQSGRYCTSCCSSL